MKALRKVLAILVGKAGITFSRMLGNQGTDFPGRIARKIYPPILKELAREINEEIFIVTGTNGKTTTTNMIAAMIREKNYNYVHNQAGANMLGGITTAFIEATNLNGKKSFDYALLETDEANVPLLLKELTPRVILITNFFRDQLDRYGELDHTINLIKDAVKDTDIELVLNADDPLVAHFQNETGLHCWYYGFKPTIYDTKESTESREGRYCVFCGQELQYERYHYAQLGKFYCPQCHNKNPQANFSGDNLQMTPTISFQANDIIVKSPYQGFYNAYNILAAVSLAKLVGIQDEIVQAAIAKYRPRAGRLETFIINEKKAILILVKNPTGLNQTLGMLNQDPASKNVFMALNDNAADGRDISWIWDADVELISGEQSNIKQIICSGQRSGDMAVRVKYSGVNQENILIKSSLEEGIKTAVELDSKVAYIISTYTALFQCQKILRKMEKKRSSEGEHGQENYRNYSAE